MKISYRLCLVALATSAAVVPALAQDTNHEVFKLTAGNVLLTTGDPGTAKLAACQPAKGNRVAAQERQQTMGMTVLHVVVLDGACKGTTGWVGIERVEALPQQQ
jgi:hypothetical protein